MQQAKFNQVRFSNGDFKLTQQEMPKPGANEVLVRVSFTSVNEYDKILLEQKSKKENFVLGAEGSGNIEDVGEGVDALLKGRKVAFCHDGWSQFCVKSLKDIILLDDSVDLKTAADAVVNPLTALCLMKLIREQKTNLCVIDGASTSLGRMVIQLCQKEGIELLAITRDDQMSQTLKSDFGLSRIISQGQGDFKNKLCASLEDFVSCVYISMLGGDVPGRIFGMLPQNTLMIVVGSLTQKDLLIPAHSFYFESKKIRGFFLERYFEEELTEQERKTFCSQIADDLKSGGQLFGTKVAKEMKLEEWSQAINQMESVAGQGKIILQCY